MVFQLPSIRPLTATDTITLFQLYYWGTWFTNFKVNLFSGPQKQVTLDFRFSPFVKEHNGAVSTNNSYVRFNIVTGLYFTFHADCTKDNGAL